MCGEMLKDSTAPEVRLYAKTLGNLELSSDETVRTDLQTLLQQLVQVREPGSFVFRRAVESLELVVSISSRQNTFTIS